VITDKDDLTKVQARYRLNHPFILALAGVAPRKNTRRIIEAFALLQDDVARDYQLVLVGLPPSAKQDFLQYAQNLSVANQVVFTGFIPEEDLVALYNLAKVFVYPSLYEGFGLPVLEAMTCGTPVITSPRGSLPEVAGDAALFVEPLDPEAICRAIIQVVTDKDKAEKMRKQGFDRVNMFSWHRAAEEMLQIYESVVRT
jgi:glycosyltransferase involved in cell wall biosynthesis